MPHFFFNDTATTEIYTLSLHDALPIFDPRRFALFDFDVAIHARLGDARLRVELQTSVDRDIEVKERSEEHTSELQSPDHLVCRLLLEKKKRAPNALSAPHTRSDHHRAL